MSWRKIMGVPWDRVRAWLRDNTVDYQVFDDNGSRRIHVELTKKDGSGGLGRSYILNAEASATVDSLGSFRTNDLIEAAQALRIDWP
jgi:hypothetical protein